MFPDRDSPAIDPDYLCDAWLEAHFGTAGRSKAGSRLRPDRNTITLPVPQTSLSDRRDFSSYPRLLDCKAVVTQPRASPLDFSHNHAVWNEADGGNGATSIPSIMPSASPVPAGASGLTPDMSPAQVGEPVLDNYAASINTASASTKRKAKARENSPSKCGSTQSDTDHKRAALSASEPRLFFGIPNPMKRRPTDVAIPSHVVALLRRFSTSTMEVCCVPQTHEIDEFLQEYFHHEVFEPHTRLEVPEMDRQKALELLEFAVAIHRQCLYNSLVGEDEAGWQQPVRRLLSVELPLNSYSSIPIPPDPDTAPDDEEDDLQTIDASMKITTTAFPPAVNIKLDALIVYNTWPHPLIRHATEGGLSLNVFSDPTLKRKVVMLGVAVNATGSNGGELDAEYQVAVWGMKTLHLTRELARSWSLEKEKWCNVAVSISVCGHAWNMHVTYWRGDGAMVTHGPVPVGSTASLYGTFKIIKWVNLFKKWARGELIVDWLAMLGRALGDS